MNWKNPVGLDLQVFGESAIERHAVGAQVFTKEKIAAHAIKARPANGVAVGHNPLAWVEPGNVATNRHDLTGELVAWNKWETGLEFTLMNVQVGST